VAPTIYVFLGRPRSESATLRNALIGHVVAVAAGVATIAAFGLWHSRGSVKRGYLTPLQAGAAAVGVGATLLWSSPAATEPQPPRPSC